MEKIGEKRNDKDRRNLAEFMLAQAVLGNKNGFHKCPVGERKASQKAVSLISERKTKNPVFLPRPNHPLFFFPQIKERERKKGCNNWEIMKILSI